MKIAVPMPIFVTQVVKGAMTTLPSGRGEQGCEPLGAGAQCGQINQEAVCFPGCNDNDCSAFRRCDQGRCVVRGDCRAPIVKTVLYAAQFARRPMRCASPDARAGQTMRMTPITLAQDSHDIGRPQDLQICDADDDWYTITIPQNPHISSKLR